MHTLFFFNGQPYFQRIETAAKKAKLVEEKRLKKEQKIREKLENMWQSKGYTSRNLPLGSEDESDTDEEEDDVTEDNLTSDFQDIKYVSGDVSMPKSQDGDSIIVHCVGNSTLNHFISILPINRILQRDLLFIMLTLSFAIRNLKMIADVGAKAEYFQLSRFDQLNLKSSTH